MFSSKVSYLVEPFHSLHRLVCQMIIYAEMYSIPQEGQLHNTVIASVACQSFLILQTEERQGMKIERLTKEKEENNETGNCFMLIFFKITKRYYVCYEWKSLSNNKAEHPVKTCLER